MKKISNELIQQITEQLEEYQDHCSYEGHYCLDTCAHCMNGSCAKCAEPYFDTYKAIQKILWELDDLEDI